MEIDENCYTGDDGKGAGIPTLTKQQKVKKVVVRNKAPLMLGPVITQETVLRAPYDIFTINENNDRVAWKPPHCHKVSPHGVIPLLYIPYFQIKQVSFLSATGAGAPCAASIYVEVW